MIARLQVALSNNRAGPGLTRCAQRSLKQIAQRGADLGVVGETIGRSAVPLSIEHGRGKARVGGQAGHIDEGCKERRGNHRWVQLETERPYWQQRADPTAQGDDADDATGDGKAHIDNVEFAVLRVAR